MEGWKSLPAEIQIHEEKFNNGLNSSAGRLHRIQSMVADGEHSTKRRALEGSPEDAEMTDRDRVKNEPASPQQTTSADRGSSSGDIEMESASSTQAKGKGLDLDSGQLNLASKRKEPMDEALSAITPFPSEASRSMLKSELWVWDHHAARYKVNWKYLYDMRLKLEQNWDVGKFTNFQLPHPDYPEEGHRDCIYTIQFDQNYVVSGSRDHTIRIWSMQTKRLMKPPLEGHSQSVLCLQYDPDPEEDLLVSGSSDSQVLIWKFSTGELVQTIKAHSESVLNVRFDKRVLVTSSKDKCIKIFNRRSLRYGDAGYGPADHLVSPVGTTVKRYGHDPSLADELPIKPPFTQIGRLMGHNAAVNAIQVLGDKVVSVSGDRNVKVWGLDDSGLPAYHTSSWKRYCLR